MSAAGSNSSRERCALAAEALRQSGRLRLRVYGESMLPALWPGDVVEIARCSMGISSSLDNSTDASLLASQPENFQPGEILLARRGDRFFLHRLVAADTHAVRLQADCLPDSDPLYLPEAILGRLLVASPGAYRTASRLHSPGAGARLSRALGLFLSHCGILRSLALSLHHRLFRNHPPDASMSVAAMGA